MIWPQEVRKVILKKVRFNRVLNAHAEMKIPKLYNKIIKEPSADH